MRRSLTGGHSLCGAGVTTVRGQNSFCLAKLNLSPLSRNFPRPPPPQPSITTFLLSVWSRRICSLVIGWCHLGLKSSRCICLAVSDGIVFLLWLDNRLSPWEASKRSLPELLPRRNKSDPLRVGRRRGCRLFVLYAPGDLLELGASDLERASFNAGPRGAGGGAGGGRGQGGEGGLNVRPWEGRIVRKGVLTAN